MYIQQITYYFIFQSKTTHLRYNSSAYLNKNNQKNFFYKIYFFLCTKKAMEINNINNPIQNNSLNSQNSFKQISLTIFHNSFGFRNFIYSFCAGVTE